MVRTCKDSSFFFTKIVGQPQGEELGRIRPFFNNSFSWVLSSASSFGGARRRSGTIENESLQSHQAAKEAQYGSNNEAGRSGGAGCKDEEAAHKSKGKNKARQMEGDPPRGKILYG